MAATTDQVRALRRMVAEPTGASYTDAELAARLEARPLTDENGLEPYLDSSITLGVVTREANTSWIPTYDLNAVAGEIWAEKANALATNFDFSADGASYSRSQAFNQAMQQSRYYLSRRAARSITVQSPTDPAALEDDE